MRTIRVNREIGALLLSFVLLPLASCGGGDGGDGGGNPPPPPPPVTYKVGVVVSGLDAPGLTLSNNGADNLAIQADGSSVFAKPVTAGGAYNVTVSSQPSNPAQQCTVSGGAGTVTADILNLAVACIDVYSSAIAPGSGTAQYVEGAAGTLGFTVNITGRSSAATTPVVTLDSTALQLQGAIDNSVANQYAVHLTTVPNLAPGQYSGQVSFQLCSDAKCTTAYPGTQQSFSYAIHVGLLDWQTFQRNAGHTGFVNVQLDPSKFTPAWTWSRPAGDSEPIGGINSVATGNGLVFVTKDIYFGQGALYALKESDGSQSWIYALGSMASEGPPAFLNGTVYVPSTNPSEVCAAWAVDAAQGTYKFRMPTACQWSAFFAPTPLSDSVLQTSEAGIVYSFATSDGMPQWSVAAGTDDDQATPAADLHYVYQYGNGGLNVLDRATGSAVTFITDPFWPGLTDYSIFSAPVIGSNNDVLSFSGFGFSGRAASSSEQYESRIIVSYDLVGKTYKWRTQNAYLTHPALANGVMYAARNAPATLDAISEADGQIQWSWTPPAGDSSFHRNIVVARNLLFVSTDMNVYAIDLKTHQAVWHYPKPGMIAISAAPMLYIVTGATLSDGNLVAIKLD
jgi:outer membrane protein assembly factor BamB